MLWLVSPIEFEKPVRMASMQTYTDFKKVFDTVNHTILLHKLAHYGGRGIESILFI